MKRILTLALVLVMAFALVACNSGNDDCGHTSADIEMSNEQYANAKIKSEGVMTYAEYNAAALDTEVVIEAYVQATQSWWDNKVTAYLADLDGAYFVYEMACSEADAAKLTPGTKIKVSGTKGAWSGEVEIMDPTFTFVGNENDTYIAPKLDVTSLLGKESLIKYQNQAVCFKGVTVKAVEYKNGQPGDDIYVTVTKDGADYSFCVEYYLTNDETDVYKAFANIAPNTVVDIEGFLYWYNGVNTHITNVTVK